MQGSKSKVTHCLALFFPAMQTPDDAARGVDLALLALRGSRGTPLNFARSSYPANQRVMRRGECPFLDLRMPVVSLYKLLPVVNHRKGPLDIEDICVCLGQYELIKHRLTCM